MHELSLALAVVETVGKSVGDLTVLGVTVRVGVMAGVVPESLHFGWEIATKGTALAGATLTLERVPLPTRCFDCAHQTTTVLPPPQTCEVCGGQTFPTTPGRELELVAIEVEDANPATPTAATGEPR